jgi:SAM-dependent methyltransferase
MGWEQAGAGWGARALEWAYLFEPYSRPANELVFDRLEVGDRVRLLDVACGSGFAARIAADRGAVVAGLDAAESLVAIARVRTPEGDFRVGDMFALPLADASFDVVTSFNGIWKGCEGALEEARRVLVPGGRLGLTFWGPFDRLGLMPYFLKVIELSPPDHGAASVDQGDTARVIESMLAETGYSFEQRGTVTVTNEWPDIETAVRAMAAAGPSVPAIEAVGYDAFCDALRDVVAPLATDLGVRIDSDFGWVTATASTATGQRDAERGRSRRAGS